MSVQPVVFGHFYSGSLLRFVLCLVMRLFCTGACATHSVQTVLETAYLSILTVLVCASKIWHVSAIRRGRFLYVLLAKASLEDTEAVSKDSLSTET